MKISTITINFNHKYFPKLCVEALEASKTTFPFEIIFVDNVSTDPVSVGFLDKAAEEKRIKLIKTHKNIGFARGNNLGAEHALGEYLLFLNPDTVVYPDALQKMADYMDKHSEVGALGPQLIYANGDIQDSFRRFPSFMDLLAKRTFLNKIKFFKNKVHRYTMFDENPNIDHEVDWLVGAAILMPRKLFKEIGGFDKRYFLFMEDADLCREVHKKKLKVIYFPDAKINHYHKRLSGGGLLHLVTKKVFWHHVSSMFKYFYKWM